MVKYLILVSSSFSRKTLLIFKSTNIIAVILQSDIHCHGTVKGSCGEATWDTMNMQFTSIHKAQRMMGDVATDFDGQCFPFHVLKELQHRPEKCLHLRIVFGPMVGVNPPYNNNKCVISLYWCLQQGAGDQLHLWGIAAVGGPDRVGSQVGQQQLRAAVQQTENVLC